MLDHRRYIDGIVIELGDKEITVATHYTVTGFTQFSDIQSLLIEAALRLQLDHGIPFAVVMREDEDEPRT